MAPRQSSNNYMRKYYKQKSGGGRFQIYGSAVKQLASDAMKGVQYVKQLINTEFDYKDTTTSTTVTSGGALQLLNGLSQGDTASSRTGNSIRMKSLDFRYVITNNATGLNCNLRVLLVMDKQANGVAPAVTDILATNTVTSPRNLDNRKRFKVLMDRCFSTSTAGPANMNGSYFKKDQNSHVAYYNSSNAGTIADIASNSLYLVYLSDQATNGPSLNSYFRLRFIDN